MAGSVGSLGGWKRQLGEGLSGAIRRTCGVEHAPVVEVPPRRALGDLAGSLGVPRSLRELGMTEADIPRVVALAAEHPYANPRPAGPAELDAVLRAAWAGVTPGS